VTLFGDAPGGVTDEFFLNCANDGVAITAYNTSSANTLMVIDSFII
jgi:hypothetical protein